MNALDVTKNDLASHIMQVIEAGKIDHEEAMEALIFDAAFLLAGFTKGRLSEENLEQAVDLFVAMYEHNCGYSDETVPANISIQ
jgi:hypothetical protein